MLTYFSMRMCRCALPPVATSFICNQTKLIKYCIIIKWLLANCATYHRHSRGQGERRTAAAERAKGSTHQDSAEGQPGHDAHRLRGVCGRAGDGLGGDHSAVLPHHAQ